MPRSARASATTVTAARDGALDDWAATPRGRLALILLLDQFTRNLHRGTPRAYENDARALALAETGLDQHDDAEPVVRGEDVLLPAAGALRGRGAPGAPPRARRGRGQRRARRRWQGAYASFSKHARMYLEQIRRFGRFPHRNMILGRTCTQEEMAFLDSPSANG